MYESERSAIQESKNDEVQFSARLGQARIAFYQKDYEAAIASIEPWVKDLPSDQLTSISYKDQIAAAYVLLARSYTEEERFQDAADAYASYLELRPGIIDAYIHDLRGDALFSAQNYANAAIPFDSALQSPGQLDWTFIQMKKARSLALSGNTTEALAYYDQIYTQTENDFTRALIDLRKGQIYTSLGMEEEAHYVYLDAVNNYPSAYESYSALLELVEAGVQVDELNRGLVDFFAGEYGVALAAFDRYLQDNPADPGTAYYYAGLAHRSGGRSDLAIEFWDKLINQLPDHPYWDEAWEQKGFTQWYYQEDYQVGTETLFKFAIENPTHPRAAEFLNDAARCAERGEDLSRAAEIWRSLTLQYPDDERSANGLFLAEISHYPLEDFPAALLDFQGALGISQTPSDRARAYLWIGKTLQQTGKSEEARKSLGDAASVDPTGYYSERARDILNNRQPFEPPGMFDLASDVDEEKLLAENWLRDNFVTAQDADLSGVGKLADEPVLVRGTELWNLGFLSDARLEFESLRQAVIGEPILTYQLANYLTEMGLFRSATFASRHILDLAGLDDASSLVVFGSNYFFPSVVAYLSEFGYPAPVALTTLNQFSELFFMAILPFCVARFGLKWVIVIGMSACAVRYFIFPLQGFQFALIGLLFHGMAYAFLYVAAYMFGDRVAPAHLKASVKSLLAFLLLGIGQVLSGYMFGYQIDRCAPAITKTVVTQEGKVAKNLPAWNVPEMETSGWRYLDLAKSVKYLKGDPFFLVVLKG